MPMVERPKFTLDTGEEDVDPALYRKHVGKLIQLTYSRYDISLVVGICNRYAEIPTPAHATIKRIWRYLNGTRDYGILFVRGEKSVLTGHVDSNYAGDTENGQSTTGFIFQLRSSPISWHSKRQTTVALSSTEAEYRSLSDATRELVRINTLLTDLRVKQHIPTTIFCDNESAIKFAYIPVFHQWTKHISTHYHYSREKIESREIQVLFKPSYEQLANLFTKPLGKNLFEKFSSKLHLVSTKLISNS